MATRSAKHSSSKKKSTAREHAEQRMLRQSLDKSARVPRSVKEMSQGRFPGETPLTGEDRPLGRSHGKQHGYRQDTKFRRDDLGANADRSSARAPATKRRPKKTMRER
jgi:hypothetical protein